MCDVLVLLILALGARSEVVQDLGHFLCAFRMADPEYQEFARLLLEKKGGIVKGRYQRAPELPQVPVDGFFEEVAHRRYFRGPVQVCAVIFS